MGATTVWERWDSMLEDGSVNPGEMTSFNHYAFGAIADWLHRVLGGPRPAAPGLPSTAGRSRTPSTASTGPAPSTRRRTVERRPAGSAWTERSS